MVSGDENNKALDETQDEIKVATREAAESSRKNVVNFMVIAVVYIL
jgi:hypothetical protein